MKDGLQHEAYQMVLFNALACTGSLTKAADKLGMSVSHVSKQLNVIEERLQTQLINRNTRALTLTEEGKDFASYSEQIVNLIHLANTKVPSCRDELSGNVRLALSCSFGNLHVLPVLDALQKKYPDLNIEVSLFDYKIDMLDEGFDLWFTTFEEINIGYVAQRIVDTHFILLASPDYIQRYGEPAHPDDLIVHNCVTYHSKDRSYTHWLFEKEGKQRDVRVNGNYRVDKAEAIRDAVMAGRGIGYIGSYLLTDELEKGELLPLMQDWKPMQKMPVYAVYPRNQNLPTRLKMIIDAVKQSIGQPAYWDENLSKWLKR
ncbi:LysR family transcriptional regulator [Shewanella sp. Isolate13]|uniref:LysR family transcriptional regulator n=1 Tax=Shewanella sp. Isolate13 TaxID=2908531 RepID=UPI001EFD5584|nr:LysR family transcriptional regulator [Shewanella sp. Isolate13]MCG9731734.1 LysR family transcriptional regulator [Shewanella sp. Isolate13]